MKRIKRSGRFSLLAVLLITTLLLTSNFVFANDNGNETGISFDVSLTTEDEGSLIVEKEVNGDEPAGIESYKISLFDQAGAEVDSLYLADGDEDEFDVLDGTYIIAETAVYDGVADQTLPGNLSISYSGDIGAGNSVTKQAGTVAFTATIWNTMDSDAKITLDEYLDNHSGDSDVYPLFELRYGSKTGTLAYSGNLTYEQLEELWVNGGSTEITITAQDCFNQQGYELQAGTYHFTVHQVLGHPGAGECDASTEVTSIGTSTCVKVTNEFAEETASLKVIKEIDEGSATPPDSFEFNLYRKVGDIFELYGSNPYTIAYPDPGYCEISNLPVGIYRVEEITDELIGLVSGYPEYSDDEITLTDDNDADNPGEVTITNKFETNKAYLQINKYRYPDDTAADFPQNEFKYYVYEQDADDANQWNLIDEDFINNTGAIFDIPKEVIPGAKYRVFEDIPELWSNSFDVDGASYNYVDSSDYGYGVEFTIPDISDNIPNVLVTVEITNQDPGYLIVKKAFDGNGTPPANGVYKFNLYRYEYSDGDESGYILYGDNPYELNEDNEYQIAIPVPWEYRYKVVEMTPDYDAWYDVSYTGDGDNGNEAWDIMNAGASDEITITNYFERHCGNKLTIIKKIDKSGASPSQNTFEMTLMVKDDNDKYVPYETEDFTNPFSIGIEDDPAYTIENLPLGQYKVVETTTGISHLSSVKYDVDGPEVQDDGSIVIYTTTDEPGPSDLPEIQEIDVTVTNKFSGGGGGGGDTWPQLTIKKEIGAGTATQDTFTVELQKLTDDEWSTVDTFSIKPDNSKTVYMKQYGAGTYRVIEITDGIDNFDSVSYSVSGDTTDNEYEFEVVKNGRNSSVVVTNNFEDEEEIIIEETIPAEPIIVPEPAPVLPKTGAAPIAAGLGLMLAAGGLAIRRIKK